MNAHNVGRNIRNLRRALGWTQADLARAIAGPDAIVQNVMVSNMENGKTVPTYVRVCAYARALGVTPQRLFDESLCATCQQQPPRWFTCRVCGAAG